MKVALYLWLVNTTTSSLPFDDHVHGHSRNPISNLAHPAVLLSPDCHDFLDTAFSSRTPRFVPTADH